MLWGQNPGCAAGCGEGHCCGGVGEKERFLEAVAARHWEADLKDLPASASVLRSVIVTERTVGQFPHPFISRFHSKQGMFVRALESFSVQRRLLQGGDRNVRAVRGTGGERGDTPGLSEQRRV